MRIEKMKVDEVIKEVRSVRYKALSESNHEPQLAIYVTYDFYAGMVSELHGKLPATAYEMYSNSTIYGYNVWRVEDGISRNGKTATHPPFRVVTI